MPAPVNDLCINATVIGSLPYSVTGVDNTLATTSGDDPLVALEGDGSIAGAGAAALTVWWKYTPPADATLHVSCSSFDITVAVFTGACGAFTEVVSWYQEMTFPVTGGVTYYFMVDSFDGAGHVFDLAVTSSSAPSNQLQPCARTITSLPFSETQNAELAVDQDNDHALWFKYTAVAGDDVLGGWGFANLVTYRPFTAVFLGPTNLFNPTFYEIGAASAQIDIRNKPFQIPVTAGETYYFRVRHSTLSAPALMTFALERAPSDIAPRGSILIPDDIDGFPATILSATTGAVLRVIYPFPEGESCFVLADGTLLTEEKSAGTLKLYDRLFVEQATVAFDLDSSGAISGNKVDRFYVAKIAGFTVRAVDAAGVLGATWTVASAPSAIAVSPDESILYYGAGTVNTPIKRWDLVNDMALSNLTAAPGAAYTRRRQILCLTDGTVLAGYTRTGPQEYKVYRYNADGTVANIYDFSADATSAGFLGDNQIAHSLDDPDNFWVWLKQSGGMSRFRHVRAIDGFTLLTFDAVQYETGQYQAAETSTPGARFGHSESCPFVVLPVASVSASDVPPYTRDEAIAAGTVGNVVIRWLRRTPHVRRHR